MASFSHYSKNWSQLSWSFPILWTQPNLKMGHQVNRMIHQIFHCGCKYGRLNGEKQRLSWKQCKHLVPRLASPGLWWRPWQTMSNLSRLTLGNPNGVTCPWFESHYHDWLRVTQAGAIFQQWSCFILSAAPSLPPAGLTCCHLPWVTWLSHITSLIIVSDLVPASLLLGLIRCKLNTSVNSFPRSALDFYKPSPYDLFRQACAACQ